jgi:hypothetical protein
VALPFFFDDLDHFEFIWSHDLGEIWASSGGFPYYRPLGGTLWWALSELCGRNNPVPHHALNLLLFLLSGLLAGWLADKLWNRPNATPNWPRRWLATTLFLLFPFSYQAVPWIGAVYHPLVILLTLVALAGYWRYQFSGSLLWLQGVGSADLLSHPLGQLNGRKWPLEREKCYLILQDRGLDNRVHFRWC